MNAPYVSPFHAPAPPVDSLALARAVRAFCDAHKALIAAGLSPQTQAGYDALLAVDWPTRGASDVTEPSGCAEADALANALVTLDAEAAPYIAFMSYPSLAHSQWAALAVLSDEEEAYLAFALGSLTDPVRIHRDDTVPVSRSTLALFNALASVLFVLVDGRAFRTAHERADDKNVPPPGAASVACCLGGGDSIFKRLSRTVLRAWPGAPNGIAQGFYNAQSVRIDSAREVVERLFGQANAFYCAKFCREGLLDQLAEATKTLVPDMHVSGRASAEAARKSLIAKGPSPIAGATRLTSTGLSAASSPMVMFGSARSYPVFRMLTLMVETLTWCSAARHEAIDNGGLETAATAILALREVIANNADCAGGGAAALETWLTIERKLRQICDGPKCELEVETGELRRCSRCQTAKYCCASARASRAYLTPAAVTCQRQCAADTLALALTRAGIGSPVTESPGAPPR